MKRRVIETILSLALTVAMVTGAPAMTFAAEDTAVEQTETTDEADEAAAEDFQVGDLTVKNTTTVKVKNAEIKEGVKETADSIAAAEETADADSKEATEATADADSKEATEATEEKINNLVLTMEDGTEHIFEDVKTEDWNEPSLYEEYGMFYISYKDVAGKDQEASEKADEKAFDEEKTVYATTKVNVREEPSTDAKAVKVVVLGAEFKATAVCPGWIKVKGETVEGYVSHLYVTEDKEKVDQLVAEQKAAEEAAAKAAAEAQAAAAAQAQAAAEAQAAAAAQPVTEVSRQAYDDCDGSGHGYYEITYSDGSVGYEEY
ncbi:SH3 domain-containing protein [Blautia sp. HCP28S3_G10]|uniref:SH3 domain-containing protein n=1 Tax=Blautia sp. HCP28S3_G10 TaxID=3438908 RepID=UPI003F8BB6FB